MNSIRVFSGMPVGQTSCSSSWKLFGFVDDNGPVPWSCSKFHKRWRKIEKRGGLYEKMYSHSAYFVESSAAAKVIGKNCGGSSPKSHLEYVDLMNCLATSCGVVLSNVHDSVWVCAYPCNDEAEKYVDKLCEQFGFRTLAIYDDLSEYRNSPRLAATKSLGSASFASDEAGWLVVALIDHLQYLLGEAEMPECLIRPLLSDNVESESILGWSCASSDQSDSSVLNVTLSAEAVKVFEGNLVPTSELSFVYHIKDAGILSRVRHRDEDSVIRYLWNLADDIAVGEILACCIAHDVYANIVMIENLSDDEHKLIMEDSLFCI